MDFDDYRVENSCLVWDNAPDRFERPFHCPGTRAIFLASFRPAWMMKAEHVLPPRHLKLGQCIPCVFPEDTRPTELRTLRRCQAIDSGWSMAYAVDYDQVTICCEFIPLRDAVGFICRLSADRDIPGARFGWEYGALDQTDRAHSPWEPGQQTYWPVCPGWKTDTPNILEIEGASFSLRMAPNPEVRVMGQAGETATYIGVDGPAGPRVRVILDEDITGTDRPAACLVVVWGQPDEPLQQQIAGVLADSRAETERTKTHFEVVSRRITLDTPDERLDLAMRRALLVSDACWYPPAMRTATNTYSDYTLVWRSTYGLTIAGWHNRVASTLRFHARHRNTAAGDAGASLLENHSLRHDEILPGRIFSAVNPLTRRRAGHHDVVQLFIDYVYQHWCWTGDLSLAEDIWPILVEAESWQRAARDPDGDGLYANVLNTWISDIHEYHQGRCMVASAYAYGNNLAMAEMARRLGQDDSHYVREADKILDAVQQLWIEEKDVFAEYRDAIGVLHPQPESTSVYHPIQNGLPTAAQAHGMLKYARRNLLHPGGMARGNTWLPGVRGMFQVVPSETLDLAHAAYIAGDGEFAWTLLDGFLKATLDRRFSYTKNHIPLTFQEDDGCVQVLEIAGLFIRDVVEGVFGIRPRLQDSLVGFRPQVPETWRSASLRTPDAGLGIQRDGDEVRYTLWTARPARRQLQLSVDPGDIADVVRNGESLPWMQGDTSVLSETSVWIEMPEEAGERTVIVRMKKDRTQAGQTGRDPQPLRPTVLSDHLPDPADQWWFDYAPAGCGHHPLDLSEHFNEDFRLLYRRTPPEMRYGASIDNRKPAVTRKIDDGLLRRQRDGDVFQTSIGVPFRIGPADAANSIFVISPRVELFRQGYLREMGEEFYSLEYPQQVTFPVDAAASALLVLLAGMTSCMQSHVPALCVTIAYADGGNREEIWSTPKDFDVVMQHYSRHFAIPLGGQYIRPYWLNAPAYEMNRQQEHLDVARIETDPARTIESLTFEVLSLDTTLAVLGVTLQQPDNTSSA